MKTISEFLENSKKKISGISKGAFFAALITGFVTHLTVIAGDFPNHDGLGSLYFDQNMITSGRWFLGSACGISSYFALPWLIGVLSILYLSVAAAFTAEILELKSKVSSVIVGALMASFPVLASTFCYVFTMDGYMLGLLFGVLAVFITKKFRLGWIAGGVLLAFSLGTYQAYLPFVIMLCMYVAVLIAAKKEATEKGSGDLKNGASGETGTSKGTGTSEKSGIRSKFFNILHFLYMGVLGGALYYIILRIMLALQGKTLGAYQGINSLDSAGNAAAGAAQSEGLIHRIVLMYTDFASFTAKSGILAPNAFAWIAIGLLFIAAAVLLVRKMVRRKWFKSIWMYVLIVLVAVILPPAANIVMIISGDVTYHALMRYQWVLIPVAFVGIIDSLAYNKKNENSATGSAETGSESIGTGSVATGNVANRDKLSAVSTWILGICSCVLILCYVVTCNIGYSNLQKKYERTYAYCVRLLDRIEQTEGYYQGIPVAMIGVVSEDQYPKADLTGGITDNLIGLSGDYLLYKNIDFELFIKSYLGAELNMITGDRITEIYNSKEYILMDSFPAENSVKLVDGIIYVKTENIDYVLRDALE